MEMHHTALYAAASSMGFQFQKQEGKAGAPTAGHLEASCVQNALQK
jgi:hypothetical protein